METNLITRAILSTGCFIAASICGSAAYLLPALLVAGQNFSNPEDGFKVYWPFSRGLCVIAALLFLTAVALAVWSLIPRRRLDA